MKKVVRLLISVLVVILCTIAFVSCSDSSKVDAYVQLLDENLPGMSQPGVTFEGAKKVGTQVEIDIKLGISYAAQGVTPQMFAEAASEGATAEEIVSSAEPIEKELLTAVVDEGYSIVYNYIDVDGEVAKVVISNSDLKNALE